MKIEEKGLEEMSRLPVQNSHPNCSTAEEGKLSSRNASKKIENKVHLQKLGVPPPEQKLYVTHSLRFTGSINCVLKINFE